MFDYFLLFPNNLSTPHDEFPKNSLNKGIGVFYHEKKMVAIQDAYHFQKEGNRNPTSRPTLEQLEKSPAPNLDKHRKLYKNGL